MRRPQRCWGRLRHGRASAWPSATPTADRLAAATYEAQRPERDAAYFRALIAEEEIGGLVVGLPLHLDGREGQKACEARAFGGWLAGDDRTAGGVLGRALHDTVEAESHLLDAGLTHKQRKDRRDRWRPRSCCKPTSTPAARRRHLRPVSLVASSTG